MRCYQWLRVRIGRSGTAALFNDPDDFRRADLPVAAYPVFSHMIERCVQAPLDLGRASDGMGPRVVPFFQLDFMFFGGYEAAQPGFSLDACCNIAEGNRHVKSATTVA